jgi:acetyl-CoA acyltransferase
MKAKAAQERGRFEKEIVPVELPATKQKSAPLSLGEGVGVRLDEFMKPATTLEGLSKLKPSFRKDGTVTAGNSSGLNDGAAALLLASEDAVKKYNLKPLARIVSSGAVGVEPRIMGIGPVAAVPKALKQAGLKQDDIDLIELNEAFAAQSLAVIKELGLDRSKLNPNGGAIAVGHPLGSSGARLSVQLFNELRRQKKKYGMVTACVGGGQGVAGIYELLN